MSSFIAKEKKLLLLFAHNEEEKNDFEVFENQSAIEFYKNGNQLSKHSIQGAYSGASYASFAPHSLVVM
jgi:hypothetical protein